MEFSAWPHEYRLSVLPTLPLYQEWIADCDPNSIRWIRVIRDPYKRAVSSYRHALSFGYENAGIEHALGLKVEERGLSFDEFLDYLSLIDVSSCDEHHRQQVNPLERWVRLDRVINADRGPLLEFLYGIAEPRLEVRTRLSDEIAKVAGHHHSRRTDKYLDFAEVVLPPPSPQAEWPDYEAFLNAGTRRKIEQIYAKDFEVYAAFL